MEQMSDVLDRAAALLRTASQSMEPSVLSSCSSLAYSFDPLAQIKYNEIDPREKQII